MKIKVIDNGVEKIIEAKDLYIDKKPITFYINEHKELVKDFKDLKAHLEKREKELTEIWEKYR